jgi:hypothetical protein
VIRFLNQGGQFRMRILLCSILLTRFGRHTC